jgi:hypothetical protein
MCRATVSVSIVAVALLGLAAPAPAAARDASPAATPEAGVATEVLIEATFPAGSLPRGEVVVGLLRLTWPVGARYELPAGASGDGIVVDVVLAGRYGVRNGARLRRQGRPGRAGARRAGGSARPRRGRGLPRQRRRLGGAQRRG